MGEFEYYHFHYEMFKKAAVSFCVSIVDLIEPDQTKVNQIVEEIEQTMLKSTGIDKKDDRGQNKEYFYIVISIKNCIVMLILIILMRIMSQ